MRTITIEIESCFDCPHHEKDWRIEKEKSECTEAGRKIKDPQAIPNWCPLIDRKNPIIEKWINNFLNNTPHHPTARSCR